MLNRLRVSLRALRHRDLRLFFTGQWVSLVGTWMQRVTVSWLVYQMTGSALVLGLIAFANQFPTFIVAPFAGALADRWSRYRMVVAAQVAAMAQAMVLAALVMTGTVQVWHLIALSAVAGLISGMDIPARQALLVRLLSGTEDLPNAIALNSELIEEALTDPDPEQVRPMLSAIRKEVERLTDVTEAYLGFARLPRPNPEPIDIANVARDLVRFQEEEARRNGVTLKLEAPNNLNISADPDQIRQALLNLLRNAIEAAGDGGHVTVKVVEEKEMTCLIVEDDGPGIAEDHKEEIFEPFFSQKKHGTGLGLSVARRVAEGHGGALKLERQPAGRSGARFVLELK